MREGSVQTGRMQKEGQGRDKGYEDRRVLSAVLRVAESAAGGADRTDVHVFADGDQSVGDVEGRIPDKELARGRFDHSLAVDERHVDLFDEREIDLSCGVDARHRDLGEEETDLGRLRWISVGDDDLELIDELTDWRLRVINDQRSTINERKEGEDWTDVFLG